ncbi:hypothetical protein MNBD_PLANCTO03-682, partial [hydrothermal vent metagenome]
EYRTTQWIKTLGTPRPRVCPRPQRPKNPLKHRRNLVGLPIKVIGGLARIELVRVRVRRYISVAIGRFIRRVGLVRIGRHAKSLANRHWVV